VQDCVQDCSARTSTLAKRLDAVFKDHARQIEEFQEHVKYLEQQNEESQKRVTNLKRQFEESQKRVTELERQIEERNRVGPTN
jgi:peptidoglycan hydrolase CwlO-like protein